MVKGLKINLYTFTYISGFAATIFVLMNRLDTWGLEMYFLLPLCYSVMAWTCNDVFEYHKDGFGLKCLYLVSYIRYVVLPVYTCGVNRTLPLYPSTSYIYAIFVCCLEIIVTFAVIKIYYPKTYNKQIRNDSENENPSTGSGQDDNKNNISALIFILLLIAFVVVRGHLNDIFSVMRFFVVSSQFDDKANSWTYDIWAIQLLFAYSTIVATKYFQEREKKKTSLLNLMVPTVCAGLSCTLILTNNRMTMVYYALCGLCILLTAFPKRAKFLNSVMITILMIVMVSFTLMKNWNINATESSGAYVSNKEGASTLSAYVCGVDNIAHTYDMYNRNGYKFSAMTVVAECIKFFTPSQLPNVIPMSIRKTPTTVELATSGTEMVSVAGETLFWGSPAFGWLLDMLAVYVIVRLLVFFDIKTKTETDLGKKYIYCWLAVLYGIFMCYCIQTLWNNTTYMPMYLGLVLCINKRCITNLYERLRTNLYERLRTNVYKILKQRNPELHEENKY